MAEVQQQSQLHIGGNEYKAIDVEKKSIAQAQNGNIIDRINEYLIDMSPVKTKEKVTFFRLLATMINAGVSLAKSLNILKLQAENPKVQKMCGTLARNVEGGQSLSRAMKTFPDVFPPAQIGMIKSGEASGKLNGVLLQIADQVEKGNKVAGKIKGAMMYPIAIILVLFLVVVAVTVLVIPKLSEMFSRAGQELPVPTQILMKMSAFMTSSTAGIPNWGLVMIVAVGLVVALKMWIKTETGRYYFDSLMLILPVFGNLNRKMALAKFCNSISTLTKSGIAIVKTIKITADIVGNEIYKRRILLIADDVQRGITIAENIRDDKKMFPIMLVSMIDVGEQTAQLDAVAEKVAAFYDDEVDNVVKNLSSLMEPLVIVVLGGSVGFLAAAIMLPVMNMGEAAAA